ncbi:hypothetical protein EV424DRAFT_1347957 [Suillus variegatus]|nr:hypothetical protein EV424DRAFT_1347957 [Suillus variegatus]
MPVSIPGQVVRAWVDSQVVPEGVRVTRGYMIYLSIGFHPGGYSGTLYPCEALPKRYSERSCWRHDEGRGSHRLRDTMGSMSTDPTHDRATVTKEVVVQSSQSTTRETELRGMVVREDRLQRPSQGTVRAKLVKHLWVPKITAARTRKLREQCTIWTTEGQRRAERQAARQRGGRGRERVGERAGERVGERGGERARERGGERGAPPNQDNWLRHEARVAPGVLLGWNHLTPGMINLGPGWNHPTPGMINLEPGGDESTPGMTNLGANPTPSMINLEPGGNHPTPGMINLEPGGDESTPGMTNLGANPTPSMINLRLTRPTVPTTRTPVE